MMHTGPKGIALIKSFESFVSHVYDDLRRPSGGQYYEWDGGSVLGTLTIGYGHTNSAGPPRIHHGMRFTEAEAEKILAKDLADTEHDVERLVNVELTQGQFDACVSFTFNCGAGNFKNIARRINAGKMDEARAALALYNKSKGHILRGLSRRRAAEQALWDDEVETVVLPSEPVYHTAQVEPEPAPLSNFFAAILALIGSIFGRA